jgi:hypothetical protein
LCATELLTEQAELSVLTFITAAVVVYGLLGRRGYGRALALGGATVAGSAVVVGGTAIPTFYAVAVGAAAVLAIGLLGSGRGGPRMPQASPPGMSLLVGFVVWSTFVTLIAPLLFDGLVTVTPAATPLVAGVLTTSNIAQTGYLVLGVCVLLYIARSERSRPELIGLTAGAAIVLSAWRYLSQVAGLPFPEGVLDNSPRFAYIETAAGGAPRFRGIFSEPASLAGACLIAIAYMIPRASLVTGWRRVGTLGVAGIALYLGIVSTSATFVVAGIVTGLVAAIAGIVGFLSRRTSLSRLLSVAGCVTVVVAIWALPTIFSFVGKTVNDKVRSSSYTERSTANADALNIFVDTFGFGVGLGSARASSFLPTLLCATGAVGAILLTAFLATVLYQASGLKEYRPVLWALIALLVVKVAAGPDLSDSSGIFWISLGLLSRGILEARRQVCTPRVGLEGTPGARELL